MQNHRPLAPARRETPGSLIGSVAPSLSCVCPPRNLQLAAALVAGLLGCGTSRAELKLPQLFGNNMVVQREQPVRVWGESSPNAEIKLTLGSTGVTAHADSAGRWQTSLPAPPVGGPYILSATGDGNSLSLTNVLCGDVWLCSGQSNMQLPVKEVNPAEQAEALADRPALRLCSVAKTPNAKPVSAADIRWRVCSPQSARDFSAVACFFGLELLKDPALANVPIGLIDSSFGGTTCEGWIPQPALARFPAADLHDSLFGIKPANLYNGMIAPLGHAAFKGALWYQGESNAAHPETYPALLATMVSEWRSQFGQPDLPFLIVQLPEYANLWEGFYWPWIREMQARAAQSISHAALVVSLGTTSGFNLHPKEKLEIGRRAALAARKLAYGEAIVASGPVFRDATPEGATIRVQFDTGGQGLATRPGCDLTGFAVAGADGDYRFADARIDGDAVIVSSKEVPRPLTVRYAWGAMPQASLVNRSGLPAGPFRTDSLPCSNVELQPQQATRRVATAAYEVVVNADGMATSLVFKGGQFLSNEPGAAGGTSIPGFWGSRSLADIHELGPRLLACTDGEVTLRMAFEEKSFQWSVSNGGKDPITFQLALSPHVQVPATITDSKAVLARRNVTLSADGFDSITNTPTGALLRCSIKPGASKSLSFR